MVTAEIKSAIEEAYLENNGEMSQQKLYQVLAKKLNIKPEDYVRQVGKQQTLHNLFFRKVRYIQQSLKHEKLLTQVTRGVWKLTGTAKAKLHQIEPGKSILALSTDLGIVIISDSRTVFDNRLIQTPIDLVLTSPPYLLDTPRYYGNGGATDAKGWVAFIMSFMEPIIENLNKGASVVLNVGQDSFIKKLPARQNHIERLIIAMEDAGMYRVDTMIWSSNKPPSPAAWCSNQRYMLHTGYEPILWFSKDPLSLKSNNQRVLQPHSEKHKKFVLSGGINQARIDSDGAHVKRIGAYSKTDLNKGKIPTNHFYFANKCPFNEMVNQYAREVLNVPTHGAKWPVKLVDFLVRLFTEPGDLAVDPFGGTASLGFVCQLLKRKFVVIDNTLEYAMQSVSRFIGITDDLWINPQLIKW